MQNISERPLFNDLSVSAGDTILWGNTTPVFGKISSEPYLVNFDCDQSGQIQ